MTSEKTSSKSLSLLYKSFQNIKAPPLYFSCRALSFLLIVSVGITSFSSSIAVRGDEDGVNAGGHQRSAGSSSRSSARVSASQSGVEDFSMHRPDQPPLRIGLSIDGGGTGGLIPALELDEIENLSKKRICELFDAGAGASIGGILASGLFVGKRDLSGKITPEYNAAHFVNLFRTESKNIFGKKQISGVRIGPINVRPEYSPHYLEGLLKEKFGEERRLSEALKPILMPAVPVQDHAMNDRPDLYLFSSDIARRDPRRNFWMWQSTRATSAAPSYFPESEVIHPDPDLAREIGPLRLVDGGVLWNNPSLLLHDEMYGHDQVTGIYPNDNYAIVSLGTGFDPYTYFSRNPGTLQLIGPFVQRSRRFMADTTDERMRERCLANHPMRLQHYMRLQVHFKDQKDLADTSPEILDLYELEAEKYLDNLEDITRFLLINHDKWEDRGGRDIHAPVPAQ